MAASTLGSRKPGQEEFSKIIRSLNEDYGLDLCRPDVSLSPSKRRLQRLSDDQRQSYGLYQRLHFFHFKGCLPRRLGQFKSEAHRISRDWVHKPRADLDSLPDVSAPLGARSVEERAALRGCLQDILADAGPSKRISDEHNNGPARRTQSRLSGDNVSYNSIDSKPLRSRQRSMGTHQALITSFINPSVGSSRASPPSTIFSAAEGPEDAPESSQNTNFRPTQDYEPCMHEFEALKESFSKYDDSLESPEPQSAGASYLHQSIVHEATTESWGGFNGQEPLGQRFQNIWPTFSIPGLNEAPIAIIWEVTRAAAYCKTDLSSFDLIYNPNEPWWHNQSQLWSKLSKHRLFKGREMPARCDARAWSSALNGFQGLKYHVVVLSAELVRVHHSDEDGPIFETKLKPLSLRLGHRLARRFGSDRFLEVVLPSPYSEKDAEADKIVQWLCHGIHNFLGRAWVAFFTQPANKKIKVASEFLQMNDTKKTRNLIQEKVHFFATDGNNFRPGGLPPPEEAANPQRRTKLSYSDLLEWAVNLRASAKQPVPKLFSRLALSLSLTHPTVILEKHQICHHEHDILSDTGGPQQVMNDGIGRMSKALAKDISNSLGLSDTPSGFQGRFGSAKGMWIVDVENDRDGHWIETYPSQRKWECDFDDPQHRTFEVKNYPRGVTSASLNEQFIPILEAQSKDRWEMRRAIAQHLENDLREQLDTQAMNSPADLLSWLQKSGLMTKDFSVEHPFITFAGGLPVSDGDKAAFLLYSGFDLKTTLLNNLTWNLVKRKADMLKNKLKVEIPCSTYAFMVVDFVGVLEPDEVHFSFSSKFQVEGFSDTLLEGMDILVARAPAHFPSDIQRVRVVSKPHLRQLKDVIVFPTKGKSPLADLLSGGDYDGDTAWVCWDQDIVRNFINATPPLSHDFVREGFLKKMDTRFQELWDRYYNIDVACTHFRYLGMSFNMQPSLLGQCTKYKEKLCYHKDAVNSDSARTLSVLLSNLVDQAKTGITFTEADWLRFRCERLRRPKGFDDPEYTKEKASNIWRRKRDHHILDYLKFSVAGGIIEKGLTDFSNALKENCAQAFDPDLTRLYNEYDERVRDSTSGRKLLSYLNCEIGALGSKWSKDMANLDVNTGTSFQEDVRRIYQQWVDISPPPDLKNSRLIKQLNAQWSQGTELGGTPLDKDDWSAPLSTWSLLKASATFKLNYKKEASKFHWYMAGRQLAMIKAMIVSNLPAYADTSAVLIVPRMYPILRPDKKLIKSLGDRAQDGDSVAALDEVLGFDDDGNVIDDA